MENYEKLRSENIDRNIKFLESIGLTSLSTSIDFSKPSKAHRTRKKLDYGSAAREHGKRKSPRFLENSIFVKNTVLVDTHLICDVKFSSDRTSLSNVA